MRIRYFLSLIAAIPLLARSAEPALLKSEFIYEHAPFPQCHASTICEVNGQLIAAWFGGERESAKDVEIWSSRHDGNKWSKPRSIADGIEGEKRFPTWNPVLFKPEGQPLTLFYKVGPHPDEWWGMKRTSADDGKTWSAAERFPTNAAGLLLGPIKNKPIQIEKLMLAGSSTEHDGWKVHFEGTSSGGKSWWRTANVSDPEKFGAIQPTILVHTNGQLQALCRTQKKVIAETWSQDGGCTWSALRATSLPNPNSGIDAVTLRDGRHLLIYNHTTKGRTPLNVAVSRDGKSWQPALTIETEPGEYSYPAIIQTSDGLVHATYTWKRTRVKHAVIDPAKME